MIMNGLNPLDTCVKMFKLSSGLTTKEPLVKKEIKSNLVQLFLSHLVDNRTAVTVFLTNGVKLSGCITYADNEALALTRDGVTQLIFKHAVATVMPQDGFSIYDLVAESAE